MREELKSRVGHRGVVQNQPHLRKIRPVRNPYAQTMG